MFEYARDNSTWVDWQFDYEFGMFLVFPSDNVLAIVDELRMKYDPESAKGCQGHISLSRPLKSALTESQLAEIREVTSRFPAFRVSYGPLITYPPHPGVCFEIQPDEQFAELRKQIHSTSAFLSHSFSRDSIPSHMTIAEFGYTWEQSEELRKSLSPAVASGEFICDQIEYVIPNDRFQFQRVLTVPLDRAEIS